MRTGYYFYVKDFDKWNLEKKLLHRQGPKKLFFQERQVWWCALGVNVGNEQDGPDENFEWPVLIVKKFSGSTFFAPPLSTKKRFERFQFELRLEKVDGYVLLDQGKVVDKLRLKRLIEVVPQKDFESILARLSS